MNKLTSTEENAKTLASILEVDEAEAVSLLQISVLITVDSHDYQSFFLGKRLNEIFSRTVSHVTFDFKKEPAIEIVIGKTNPRSNAPKLWVVVSDSSITIGPAPIKTGNTVRVHPAILLLGACYTAAFTMKTLFQGLPGQNILVFDFNYKELFGEDLSLLEKTVDIKTSYLAGAGAIGNAFLYALRYFDVCGQLYIIDPKTVRDGNLNRCMLFTEDDIGFFKAERLAKAAQPDFNALELIPRNVALSKLPERTDGAWLTHLIVGVDSRRARRSLQAEIPGEVFDASTTDIREVVLHFHRQPTSGACLSCIYHQESIELAHEKHVAEALGVSVGDVQSGFVTEESALKMCRKFPQLQPDQLVGKAFDTLFKQMCGEGKLQTAEDRNVLAPFSFVSVLAGTYQAIEFVRRIQRGHEGLFNYWRISPWAPPQRRLQAFRAARSNCEFCGNKIKRQIANELWVH